MFSDWQFVTHPLSSLQKTLMALVGVTSVAITPAAISPAYASEISTSTLAQVSGVSDTGLDASQPLPDGVYLYGQSPDAEQIGATYMVFAVQHDQVVGALYMPHSSFDCFRGEFQANQLAMTVIDSYEQTAHPFAIALQPHSSVASATGAIAPLGLEGFYQLPALSDNDQRILATCQADFQRTGDLP